VLFRSRLQSEPGEVDETPVDTDDDAGYSRS